MLGKNIFLSPRVIGDYIYLIRVIRRTLLFGPVCFPEHHSSALWRGLLTKLDGVAHLANVSGSGWVVMR